MKTVYIPLGPIGSGKTTAGWEWFNRNKPCVMVSGDVFRTALHGEYAFDPRLEDDIIEAMFVLARAALAADYNVVLDDAALGYPDLWAPRFQRWQRLWGVEPKPYDVDIRVDILTHDANTCIARRMENPRGYTEARWREVYNKQMQQFHLSGLYWGQKGREA